MPLYVCAKDPESVISACFGSAPSISLFTTLMLNKAVRSASFDDILKDRLLKINTIGRDETHSDEHHSPYEPTPYCVLVHRIIINWHIHLSDCSYAALSSVVDARIDFLLCLAYKQSSCVNVPEINFSVH